MSNVVDRGGRKFYLGRIPSVWDGRNLLVENTKIYIAKPVTKAWQTGPVLDQGQTPSCVGHGSRGWELAAPVQDPVAGDELAVPDPSAVTIWQQAQLADGGSINPNDGATIHGAAKALHDANNVVLAANGKPRMALYYWTRTLKGIQSFVSHAGPMIIGVSWYNSMFNPNGNGLVAVDVGSGLAGGHCIYIHGVDMENKLFGLQNSWGNGWGQGGKFFIGFEDMQKLIDSQGEFCAGVENPL